SATAINNDNVEPKIDNPKLYTNIATPDINSDAIVIFVIDAELALKFILPNLFLKAKNITIEPIAVDTAVAIASPFSPKKLISIKFSIMFNACCVKIIFTGVLESPTE